MWCDVGKGEGLMGREEVLGKRERKGGREGTGIVVELICNERCMKKKKNMKMNVPHCAHTSKKKGGGGGTNCQRNEIIVRIYFQHWYITKKKPRGGKQALCRGGRGGEFREKKGRKQPQQSCGRYTIASPTKMLGHTQRATITKKNRQATARWINKGRGYIRNMVTATANI